MRRKRPAFVKHLCEWIDSELIDFGLFSALQLVFGAILHATGNFLILKQCLSIWSTFNYHILLTFPQIIWFLIDRRVVIVAVNSFEDLHGLILPLRSHFLLFVWNGSHHLVWKGVEMQCCRIYHRVGESAPQIAPFSTRGAVRCSRYVIHHSAWLLWRSLFTHQNWLLIIRHKFAVLMMIRQHVLRIFTLRSGPVSFKLLMLFVWFLCCM